MKTVKEVSEELGYSDVTIYAHLKKNRAKLKSNVVKKQGVTHIKEAGVHTLKESLGIIQVPEIQQQLSYEDIIKDVSETIAKDIKDSNEDMRAELEEVKKQNKILIDMMQDKKNKTLLDKFKDLFKYE